MGHGHRPPRPAQGAALRLAQPQAMGGAERLRPGGGRRGRLGVPGPLSAARGREGQRPALGARRGREPGRLRGGFG